MEDKKRAMIERNRKIIRWASFVCISLTIALGIWIASSDYFKAGHFQKDIERMGVYAPIIFIIFQVIQVVYPVIPGGVVTVAGYVVFNPVLGTIYNVIGIFIGSVINFLLARRFGRIFVEAFVSEDTYNKYVGWLDKGERFTYFLFFAFFLPAAPDDFLCMLAGLTKMSLKKFIIIWWLTKPFSTYFFTWMTIAGIDIFRETIFPWLQGIFG